MPAFERVMSAGCEKESIEAAADHVSSVLLLMPTFSSAEAVSWVPLVGSYGSRSLFGIVMVSWLVSQGTGVVKFEPLTRRWTMGRA